MSNGAACVVQMQEEHVIVYLIIAVCQVTELREVQTFAAFGGGGGDAQGLVVGYLYTGAAELIQKPDEAIGRIEIFSVLVDGEHDCRSSL